MNKKKVPQVNQRSTLSLDFERTGVVTKQCRSVSWTIDSLFYDRPFEGSPLTHPNQSTSESLYMSADKRDEMTVRSSEVSSVHTGHEVSMCRYYVEKKKYSG